MSSESRTRIPLAFGPGLDRATGPLVVEPGAMEDLRNVYLLDAKVQARKGFAGVGALSVSGVPEITHVLGGHPLRSEGVGIVVGWAEPAGEVHVFRVDPDGTGAHHLGKWFDSPDGDFPPVVHLAESFGRIFMAHDEPRPIDRASTFVYDPVTPQDGLLGPVLDWDEEEIAFRGVVTHLDYLVGWGYGTSALDLPELVRISLPGQPRTFEERHYFIVGDRRDPVIQCVPGASSLIAFKGGEWHELFGTHRGNFGMIRRDPLHGLLAPRLAVNVSGVVFFFAPDGPRMTDGSSPSQSLELPLDLDGFEAADLPQEADPCEAFATYVWGDRIVLFIFGQRAYALTIRRPEDMKWSYWTFPWKPLCAFTLWDSIFSNRRGDPLGYPEWDGEEPAGTYVDIDVVNVGQEGDERLEVWLRDTAEDDAYELALSTDVHTTEEQKVRVTGLTPGITYAGGIRYRRGNQVAEGYTGSPANWPSVSQGEFTTVLDPPELGEMDATLAQRFAATGEEDWVWERTASDAQYLQFLISPDAAAGAGQKIKIYRTPFGGAESMIAELEEGTDFEGFDPFLWKDEDPPQGDVLNYRGSTVVASNESPKSDALRLWPGPQPEGGKGPVPATRTTFIASGRASYTHTAAIHRLQEVVGDDHSEIRFLDNWDDAAEEYTSAPDQERGEVTYGWAAEPKHQQPPEFGRLPGSSEETSLGAKKDVSLAEPLPSGTTVQIGVQFAATRFGVTDVSELFIAFVAVP